MAHRSALIALALAGALASPGFATGREFIDGAPGHCLLCDLFSQLRKRNADADCRSPAANDVGASEQADERIGDLK
ncbi:hypothetical protein IYX23_14360 [Methylocystis sp. L43]|jgi:hypothetical protein|uniref:hypothetical protein n=1 Tax=unclassified Methylocystis TaxID=2625913 RepID=UPI0018C2278B|nr:MULTISPECIES: hypothetical protein [unclassified Methylocystis]MBG0798850.1 hypothetical protein [Methylocystis sp. L43]MBG0806357.1 hypothetical protein [Methylocystis sp. H15]